MAAYAIISDVHSNLEALEAVLDAIKKEGIDQLLFLGDAVGYGPNPGECLQMLKQHTGIMLAGNHDWGAAGLINSAHFNPYAQEAIRWTHAILSPEDTAFIKTLPLTRTLRDAGIFLVHATPKEPEKWHYFFGEYDAYDNFPFFKERLCFVGHSHVPVIIERSAAGAIMVHHNYAEINDKSRYIINAGSIGQPRDGNPDAAYALLKDNTIEIKRVSYDILLTQKKMRKAKLPAYLINRLSVGR